MRNHQYVSNLMQLTFTLGLGLNPEIQYSCEEETNLQSSSVRPYSLSLVIKSSCGTLSNAFEGSFRVVPAKLFESNAFLDKSITFYKTCSQPYIVR